MKKGNVVQTPCTSAFERDDVRVWG